MNLRDFHYVIAVKKHKHFGKAADDCFVSQPTLSAQIKKLEDELGVILFERSNKQVFITDAGEILINKMQSIVNMTQEIKKTAEQLKSPENISLKLALIPTLGPYLLPRVLPAIKKKFKKLKLNLYEEQTDIIHENLKQGSLDAIILALPIDTEGLHCTPLFSEDFYVVLPRQHPLTKKSKISTSALKQNELMLLAEGHCLRDQALDVCHLQDNGDYHATSLETLYQMVASGQGVTLLPKLAAYSRTKTVIKAMQNEAKRDIVMLWRKQSIHAQLLQELAHIIQLAANDALDKPL